VPFCVHLHIGNCNSDGPRRLRNTS